MATSSSSLQHQHQQFFRWTHRRCSPFFQTEHKTPRSSQRVAFVDLELQSRGRPGDAAAGRRQLEACFFPFFRREVSPENFFIPFSLWCVAATSRARRPFFPPFQCGDDEIKHESLQLGDWGVGSGGQQAEKRRRQNGMKTERTRWTKAAGRGKSHHASPQLSLANRRCSIRAHASTGCDTPIDRLRSKWGEKRWEMREWRSATNSPCERRRRGEGGGK